MLKVIKNSILILCSLPLLVGEINDDKVYDMSIFSLDDGYRVTFIATSELKTSLKVVYKNSIKIDDFNVGVNSYSFEIKYFEFNGQNEKINIYFGNKNYDCYVINYINNQFNNRRYYIYTRPMGIDFDSNFIYESLIFIPYEFELWTNIDCYIGPIAKVKSNKSYEEIKNYNFTLKTKNFSKKLNIMQNDEDYELVLDMINFSGTNNLLDYSILLNSQIMVSEQTLVHLTFDSKSGVGLYEIYEI